MLRVPSLIAAVLFSVMLVIESVEFIAAAFL